MLAIHDRPTRWLLVALAAGLAICFLAVVGLTQLRGEATKEAFGATAVGYSHVLFAPSWGDDSWTPMLLALDEVRQDPHSSLYAQFFERGVKFQYPPTSLLPLTLVPSEWRALVPSQRNLGVGPAPGFKRTVGSLSLFAAWTTVVLSVVIFELALRRSSYPPASFAAVAWRCGLAIALGCFFYPVLRAHSLGQIQVYINLLAAAAILLHMVDRRIFVGVCIGLCCLLKPQMGVVLLWALFRKRWAESAGLLLVLVAGGIASLMAFGWQAHADYLTVLRTIGSQGETFWPNQSVNGLLNRFVGNGSPAAWLSFEYAPYVPIVHALTLATSAAAVAAALFLKPAAGRTAARYDFLIILLVATMASPVAWEHHYGILLPLFAASVPALLEQRPLGRLTPALLALSFAASANVVLRGELYVGSRWIGLLASHLFFGALLLLIVLLVGRTRQCPVPISGRLLTEAAAR